MRLSFEEAVEKIADGQVVAIPTETVYGLAANLYTITAIQKIFTLKNRPLINPLIVHLAEKQELDAFVSDFPPYFDQIIQKFWPGPLTCILPIKEETVPRIVRADLPTAGFRIPELELTRRFIKAAGPLVMPSANLSGKPSGTCVEHIKEDFGVTFPVLSGEPCTKGLESTIIYFLEERWVILRLGAISSEDFYPILGYHPQMIDKQKQDAVLCSGQLLRHYAPKAQLCLGDRHPLSHCIFVLGFQERIYPRHQVILLGSLNDPKAVAKNLYKILRQLDLDHIEKVWVDMDFPREGLWVTIAERLMRAALK